MAYNRLRFDNEFKSVTGVEVLYGDTNKRIEKLNYEALFTIGNLIEFRKPFADYIKNYGSELPANTRFPLFNRFANRAATYTGVIHTNQPVAKRALKIIDETREFVAKNAVGKYAKKIEAKAVIDAVSKIKEVNDYMVAQKITGTMRTAIENTLKKFKLDIAASERAQHKTDDEISAIQAIENKIKDENKLKLFRTDLANSRLIFKIKIIGTVTDDPPIQVSAKDIILTLETCENKRIISPVVEELTSRPY